MKRNPTLFYKIIAVLLIASILPALLVSLRLQAYNQELLIAGGASWSVPPQAVEEISQNLMGESIKYLIYSLVSAGIFALFISGSLVQPLRSLRELVNNFLTGSETASLKNDQVIASENVRTDEVGQISLSLQQMMNDLEELRKGLESQVLQRTQELEHRTRLQQAAAAVAQASASIRDLDTLLNRVTQLISENFGYYHVGIFLLDESGENAVLRAANSSGGQQMLARGHKLSVAETSIVGYVASTRQPRVALSVGADAVHFKNPYLPETRSEMALPLRTGSTEKHGNSDGDVMQERFINERVWGVLDVQSQAEQAFSQEDIEVLQALANQVAIAIENAQLFIENQNALAELQNALQTSRKLYGEMTGEAWRKLLQARPQSGYIADRASGKNMAMNDNIVNISPASSEWSPEMEVVVRNGQSIQSDPHTLIVPIQMRDITAGVLRLSKPAHASPWSRNEIELINTLTEQLGVALESARLYDESRRRAERERLTGEITAKLRASNDPQLILKTAMDELRQALQASQARVVLHKLGTEEAVE